MNKVTVNENFRFDIDVVNDTILVNGEPISLNSYAIDERSKHLIHQNKSYNVEVVSVDRVEKQVDIKVNGNLYRVAITTELDLLLKQLGMDSLATSKVLQVKAPMPGLVLSILVNETQEVRKGDSLLILEAMKMENVIKSPSDGLIQKIEVVKGDKIEKNTVLIRFA